MSSSSNVTIILTDNDDSNQMIIETNREILSQKFGYFEKMFSSLREKIDDVIFIKVSNSILAYDIIISSISDYKIMVQDFEPLYLLEYIKCQDFFGIQIDKTCLKSVKIEPQYFDLLLDVIDIIGYDDFTINIVTNNLPDNYDFSKFPKELLNEINRLSNLYKIIYWTRDGFVHTIDMDTGSDEDLHLYIKSFDNIYVSKSGNMIAFTLKNEVILYNTITNNKSSIDFKFIPEKCYISNMGNFIAVISHGKIYIYRIYTDLKELKTEPIGEIGSDIENICFTFDELFLFYCSGTNLHKFDLNENLKKVDELISHNYNTTICCSDNGFWICSSDEKNNIIIWSAKTGQIYKSISGHYLENTIKSMKFINNDSQILLKGDFFVATIDFKTSKIKKIYETNTFNTIIDYDHVNNHIINFQNGIIDIFDLNEEKIIKSFSTNKNNPIRKICLVPMINIDAINKIKYLVD
ncbi:WD40 repeat protein [Moumouvirus australiensis]|uniref:WD40 repeat protein n=1 Tax=Moumouvirus australiensis TaxID=2109587 RepID=A0A2P1EMQ6_9VIRU|nr:WD40 repeat protein [Moumouvirus australiensis]AVL95184.1 WD40 repeat protein [Moumouvirus australiensis]